MGLYVRGGESTNGQGVPALRRAGAYEGAAQPMNERSLNEAQRQVAEGRRRLQTEGAPMTVATIAEWLRGTLCLLVADPDALVIREEGGGEYAQALVIVPGSPGNIARVLGKPDDDTGITTIRAIRTLVGKMAGRAGLMVQIHVEAERRAR